MSIANPKLWLLQNEKAIQSIIKHPERTLATVAQMYQLDFDDLSEFLEKFNPESVELTEARLREIKIELGIISSGRASVRTVAAAEPEEEESQPPAPSVQETGIDPAPSPWLAMGRQPKASAMTNYIGRLEAMAAGKPREGSEVSWYAFLRRWLGSSTPHPTTVKRFLAWIDEGASPAAQASPAPTRKAKRPRKVKAARIPRLRAPRKARAATKAKRKYTRRAKHEDLPAQSPAEPVSAPVPVEVVRKSAPPPFSFTLLGFELIIRRLPAPAVSPVCVAPAEEVAP